MVAIDLVEGFLQPQTATLKFNLHQRQAVDQQRDIEAGFTRVLLGVELLHGSLPETRSGTTPLY